MEKYFEDEKSNNLAHECRRFLSIIKDACDKEWINLFSQVYFRKWTDISKNLEWWSYFVSNNLHSFDEFMIKKNLDDWFSETE